MTCAQRDLLAPKGRLLFRAFPFFGYKLSPHGYKCNKKENAINRKKYFTPPPKECVKYEDAQKGLMGDIFPGQCRRYTFKTRRNIQTEKKTRIANRYVPP